MTTTQQIDIVAHLEKLLFEHETVIVPTFGGFTATKIAAAVDYVGGTAKPPAKSLAFNENLTVDDGMLVHEIASQHGLTEHEARQMVLDFVQKTKNALNNRDIVTFDGIGRLYKNYAQKIQFLPDTTNFNTDSFGLPPLQFSPVARGSETTDAVPAPSKSAIPVPPPSVAETPVIPASAHTTIAENQTQEFVGAAPPSPAVVERTTQPQTSRSFALFSIAILAFSVLVGLYLYNRKKSAAGNEQSQLLADEPTPTAVIPTPGNMLEEAQKAAESENATKKKPAKSYKSDSDNDNDLPDEVEEVTAKKLEASKQKSVEKSTGSKRCVLIIGTFKDSENVKKLLKKLKDAGYNTYHRENKGHQVGIEFQYNELKEIQEKMEALQKLTGEDKIWIKRR